MQDTTLAILAVSLLIGILILIAMRDLFSWYHKVDERIKLQKETNILLKRICHKIGAEPLESEQAPKNENKVEYRVPPPITTD